MPLTNSYSSDYWQKKATADRINQFVENAQQPTFSLKQDERNYWFGGFFILIGSFIVGIFITVAGVAGRLQHRLQHRLPEFDRPNEPDRTIEEP